MNIINRIAQTLPSPAFTFRLIVCLVLLATASISHASAPYGGTPIAIPGTIEAEDYDLGGEGDAYYDTTTGNEGPASYRSDDVDHETCSEGGYNVGWTADGEWLKYTVNVDSDGSYTITTRVASDVATGAFRIEVDDVDVTGTISVGHTGGWQSWEDKTSTVSLSSGQQVIKLVIESGLFNINHFDITYNGPPPAAPTGLQVDSTGVNSVSLSWTAPAGSPTGYNVKRSSTSNGPYTTVGSTTAPTVSFTDSVTGGATYYYVISALTSGGESANSTEVSATPTQGVPGEPTGLVATAGDNQVALSWAAPTVGSPTSYNVKRSTTSGSGYVDITSPGAQTTTNYTDTTAVNGTTYYYVVSAVNAIGEGVNSSQADATPALYAGVYEPFDYPSGIITGTDATGDGIGTWTVGNPPAIVSGLTYPDLPVDNDAIQATGTRQFVSLDSPIDSGTKWISFLYKKSVGDSGGNKHGVYFPNNNTDCLWFGFGLAPYSSSQGNFGLGSTTTAGTDVQDVTQLELLGLGTYGDTYLVAMKIDFDTSGDNDTVTVYINPVANQSTPGVVAAGTHSTFDVGSISGVGLHAGSAGESIVDEIRIGLSYAEAVDAVVSPPNAPTGLVVTPGNNSVSLSWNAAGGGLPTGYNVKRASSPEGPYTTIGTTTAPTVTYTDDILGGETYYNVDSAVNGVGESADIAYVSATPVLTAPNTPSGLSATQGDSQVSLSWSVSAFATSYDVKRADDIAGPYTPIATTASLSYDDLGLNNAQTYYYVVSANGAGGSSADSLPVSSTPFGPMPFVLDIDPGTGITWFASNSVIYQVQWASEDLGTNTVWNNLGEAISGDGTTNTVFDSTDATHNFYQVLSIQ